MLPCLLGKILYLVVLVFIMYIYRLWLSYFFFNLVVKLCNYHMTGLFGSSLFVCVEV